MAFKLYYHPLSSFCWKALIALYEAEVSFEKHIVDLSDATQRAALLALNPLGKFPVLSDSSGGRVISESSILIEYLAQRVPSAATLIPRERDERLEVRSRDRFFDLYVMGSMQRIVADRLRPEVERDPRGVADARELLDTAYAMLDSFLTETTWAAGTAFSLADCAAAPALYYADKVHPLPPSMARPRAYLERLQRRPSFARVLREAEPYFAMFPG